MYPSYPLEEINPFFIHEPCKIKFNKVSSMSTKEKSSKHETMKTTVGPLISFSWHPKEKFKQSRKLKIHSS